MSIDGGLKELSAVYVCRSKKLNHSGNVLQRYQGSKIAQDWRFMCNISCFFVMILMTTNAQKQPPEMFY